MADAKQKRINLLERALVDIVRLAGDTDAPARVTLVIIGNKARIAVIQSNALKE